MKKQCRSYADFDLSRYHILSFDEMLKVNGGWGKKTSDDGSSSKSKDKSKDKGKSGSGRTDTKSNAASSKSSRGSAASQKDGKSGTKASSKSETGKKSESSANSKSKPKEVANTHEAVSKANVGDTVTRDDGTKVKLTKGDIDWAKDKCASDSGKQNSKNNSGTSSSSASSREKKEFSGSSVTTGKTGKNTAQNAVKTEETPVKKNEQENLPVSENSTKNGNSQTENPAKVVGTEKTNPAESSEKTTCESATKQKVEETGKTISAESENLQKGISADSTQNNADAELAAKKNSELNQPKSESFFEKIVSVFTRTSERVSPVESTIGNIGTYSFVVGIAVSAFDSLKKASKALLKVSNSFGVASTVIDSAQLVSEPTIENARNIAVDAILSNHPIVGLGLQSYFSVVDTIFSNQDSSPKSFDDEIMHFNSTGSLKW